jgi:hypothetical protein
MSSHLPRSVLSKTAEQRRFPLSAADLVDKVSIAIDKKNGSSSHYMNSGFVFRAIQIREPMSSAKARGIIHWLAVITAAVA